jgi:ubiquinone/menaquinone biosynthesis C-methylase UbiE
LGLYKNNYTILREIEKLSSRYLLKNFLEVGCAEGYTAHLVESIFGFKCCAIDLSLEAVKRAKEIYHLKGIVADAQSLECIKTNTFDLVLCSETIEHLPDPGKTLRELLRISKKALIITVPAAKNLREKENFVPFDEPHAHLNIFTKEDLKHFGRCNRIRGISFKWLDKIESLFTSDGKQISSHGQKFIIFMYRLGRLVFSPLRTLYGVNLAKFFIKLDYWLGSPLVFNVITYMCIYLKAQPDFSKRIKHRNILNFILKNETQPCFIREKLNN